MRSTDPEAVAASNLMGPSQLAFRPTQRLGLQRIGRHLHLVDATAPRAAERPVFKAHASLGDTLDLHRPLAHQAQASGGSARQQCMFLKLGHDALQRGGSATLSVTDKGQAVRTMILKQCAL